MVTHGNSNSDYQVWITIVDTNAIPSIWFVYETNHIHYKPDILIVMIASYLLANTGEFTLCSKHN